MKIEKMYICKSELEIRHIFEMFPIANDWHEGPEFNFDDDLPVIYVVNPNTNEFMKYIRRVLPNLLNGVNYNKPFYVVVTDGELKLERICQ